MKDFLDPRYTEAIGADLIKEVNVDGVERTYVCSLDRKGNYIEDIENEPCWQIKCVEKIGNTTRILWPDGSKNHAYIASQCETYNYKYSI